VFEFISVDDFDPEELRSAVTRADLKKLADAA
jgi:acyl-CoA dehydrogenase